MSRYDHRLSYSIKESIDKQMESWIQYTDRLHEKVEEYISEIGRIRFFIEERLEAIEEEHGRNEARHGDPIIKASTERCKSELENLLKFVGD